MIEAQEAPARMARRDNEARRDASSHKRGICSFASYKCRMLSLAHDMDEEALKRLFGRITPSKLCPA